MARLLVLWLALAALAVSPVLGDIKLQSVERKISLITQFARLTEALKVKNTGNQAVDRLVLCTLKPDIGVIAYHKATQTVGGVKKRLTLTPSSPAGSPAGAVCWEAALEEPIRAGDVATLDAAYVYAGVQEPFPAEIPQGSPQLLRLAHNVYAVSPYTVSTQTTEVALPSANVKSYTDSVQPVTKTGSTLKYGKYDLVKPWSLAPLNVHYETSKPFKKALQCVREIEVSHWGNIYVEETYEVTNYGAKHKGAFSRLRYAHQPGGMTNGFQDLRAKLPASAHSLYYVDLIGNISTSIVKKTSSETVLDFSTRYPLMGGWKTDFKIGYSLPLTGFLHWVKGGRRRLTLDVSTPIEALYVQDLTVKVVLPEGASHITYSLPFDMDASWDVKYTYLDVTGRPVLLLHKSHVVPEHGSKFSVEYSFPATGVLREPALLIAVFAVLFLSVIVYNRLEFTIARDDKWKAGQEADKVAGVMQAINSLLEEQDEVLDGLSRLLAQTNSVAAIEQGAAEKASQETTFTSLENKAKGLVASVAATQKGVADKVMAVQERLRGVQQRLLKALAEKSDLVRKGTSAAEVDKKLGPTVQGIKETRKELTQAVEALFAPY